MTDDEIELTLMKPIFDRIVIIFMMSLVFCTSYAVCVKCRQRELRAKKAKKMEKYTRVKSGNEKDLELNFVGNYESANLNDR